MWSEILGLPCATNPGNYIFPHWTDIGLPTHLQIAGDADVRTAASSMQAAVKRRQATYYNCEAKEKPPQQTTDAT